jgi:UDP-glucose 4-epimerase
VHEAINLGTGRGATVQEIVNVAEEVTGQSVHPTRGPRRRGDPPRLVASCARAAERLQWRAENSDPRRIVADAFAWHRDHPDGYPDG